MLPGKSGETQQILVYIKPFRSRSGQSRSFSGKLGGTTNGSSRRSSPYLLNVELARVWRKISTLLLLQKEIRCCRPMKHERRNKTKQWQRQRHTTNITAVLRTYTSFRHKNMTRAQNMPPRTAYDRLPPPLLPLPLPPNLPPHPAHYPQDCNPLALLLSVLVIAAAVVAGAPLVPEASAPSTFSCTATAPHAFASSSPAGASRPTRGCPPASGT